MQTRRTVRGALLLVGVGLVAVAANGPCADRPPAPADSRAKAIEREVEADRAKLKAAAATAARFGRAVDEKAKAAPGLIKAFEAARTKLKTAEAGRNTRNPTCQNGQTYADCSCNPGRTGKAMKEGEINLLKAEVDAGERKLVRARAELLALGNAVRRFDAEVKATAAKLTADTRRLAEERKREIDPPAKPRPTDELPLKKPTKPGTTPDVIPLGGKM